MSVRSSTGASMRFLLTAALAVTALAGCLIQQPNPDINRVQKPYLPKSIFNDGGSWYLRRTFVDAPPQSWYAIGEGDWPAAERIRFEIREDALILYRDYELVPGSETAEQPGSDYRGTIVAKFPITEHFDIRRAYNPVTGEQMNTIEKNTERPWFQRDYVVVDWGASMDGNPAYYVQEQERTNPDRARFGNDYLEFTLRQSAEPFLISCWGGLDWATVPDCGSGTVDIRWSLSRVDASADFEPTPFPDSVQLVDEGGQPVRDVRGHAVRVPIFDKFGFFRLERLTYDRNRGITDSGRLMRAFKFNIWKKSFGPDGQPIPFAQREPQPIIYYMNADMPEDSWGSEAGSALSTLTIKQANIEIGNDYNQVFRQVVETLQGRPLDANFRMFEVRENDCNFAHVVQFADENGLGEELEFVGGVEGFTTRHGEMAAACTAEPMGRDCSDKRQKWGYTLKQACTALESSTENNDNDQPKFAWQRLGDVRYSFVHLTSHLQSVGWLGLGMLAADPVTAEIRNAFAYVDGPGTDMSATIALDYVDGMNDQTEMADLVFGTDISTYTMQQNQKVGAKLKGYPTSEQIADVERRFRMRGERPEELLKPADSLPAQAMARLSALAGTPMERALLNQDDLMLAAGRPMPEGGDFTEEALEKVSAARGSMERMKQAYQERIKRAVGGKDGPCHYLREFIDDGLIGMALQLRDKPRVERWAYLRFMIYKTVMLHEVGHTLGLRHNFQGTYDGLNYHPSFFRKLELYTRASQAGAEREALPLDDAWTVADAGLTAGGGQAAAFAADKSSLERCISQVALSEDRWVTDCVNNDSSSDSNTVKLRNCRDALPYARETAQVLVIDAMMCLRADEGKSSSVMDYHGKLNGRFEGLGYYDKAALMFGYGQIVEEFDSDALRNITASSPADELPKWVDTNDYKRSIDDLAMNADALSHRVFRYKPWSATRTSYSPSALEVPYGFCSDERAYTGGGTDKCRLRDFGGNHREQMQHDLLRYKEYYFFTQFARNRLTWDIGAAIQGNRTIFDNILRTFQYMYFYRAFSPTFFETDKGRDFLKASQAGLDLYAEVLAQPEMGLFLEPNTAWGFTRDSRVRGRYLRVSAEETLDLDPSQFTAGGQARVAVPSYYYGTCDFGDYSGFDCNQGAQYPGFTCDNNLCAMTIPLGDGRPSYLNFTNDYEDWFFTYVGNYFDKQGVIIDMVDSASYFPQLAEEGGYGVINPNVRLLNVGVASLFGDSIRGALHGLITDRPRDYSNYWSPATGYQARSFISLERGKQPLASDDVLILPRSITNLPYLALLYGAAFQSSLDDGVLDFMTTMQVGVKGEEDDIGGWDNLPADLKAEFTHPQTGVTYRASKVGDYAIGYELVQEAKRQAQKYLDYKACTDDPSSTASQCMCTYAVKFYYDDKNGDGDINGTGGGGATDECIIMRAEDQGKRPCQTSVEPCAALDRQDKRERAMERMEMAVERLENLRGFYQSFNGSWRL
ncbi:MAG: zinc-dependent metalloprotease [Deltaproteobacteria bacterium]|nr:zinc-dependent metalloprotease [Deltaproteobacteria bacterium]